MSTAMTRAMERPQAAPPRARRVPFHQAIRRFFRTPKGLMTLVLLLLLGLAAPFQGIGVVAPAMLAAVATATLLDGLLIWLTRGEVEFPSGALLTALFLALLLDPYTPWYVAAATAALAINAKYLFHTRWSNIFNPAAIALVANYFLFGSGQSWWGALPDLPVPFILVLLATVVFIAGRINKLPMVVAFLGAYFAIATASSFLGDPARLAELFRSPDVNAALFFAGFMLTDPPTSPNRHRDQIIYGIIVAVASAILFLTLGALWFLPGGLLVGNLWEAARRVLHGRRQERARAERGNARGAAVPRAQ
ncbi:MAG: RnfABCDGE type electron transport complex subunit D [Thermomicrobiales bacterium]